MNTAYLNNHGDFGEGVMAQVGIMLTSLLWLITIIFFAVYNVVAFFKVK